MKKIIALGLSLLCTPCLEAAVAFRASGTVVTGTAANVTLTEPAGASDNDILVMWMYRESTTAVTLPSGWSDSANGTTLLADKTDTQNHRLHGYWIRRSGTPALVWTFASAYRSAFIAAYSGAVTSGDPFSFGNTAVKSGSSGTNYPNTSGTTLDNNELLLWCGGDFPGSLGKTAPTSFNERVDAADIDVADLIQASAGATGSIGSGAAAGSAGGTTAILVGLRPPASAVTACQPPFCAVIGL